MGNRDHFQGFSTHKLGICWVLEREGKLSKSTQLKTSFCQQVGHWADILGGTTTGVNPRSSTVRRGTGWIHKSFHHIMRCHGWTSVTNRVTENYYILVNFAGNPLKCQLYKKSRLSRIRFFKVIPFLGIIAHPQKVTSMLPHFQDLKLSLSLFNDGILVTPPKKKATLPPMSV